MKHRRLVGVIFGLLILQFILGMLANLYATIPRSKPYDVFHQFGFITFHALNATVLVILAIILVFKLRGQAPFKSAMGGLVSLVLAYIFGELFVFTQHSIYSLFMALAFIGALLGYARILFSGTTLK
jgi:hypothetical protein